MHVDSASNESVISGSVELNNYKTIVWILGEESTKHHTFDAAEQEKVKRFIAGGGNLFVTGSEIGWDLDSQGNGVAFFENTLKGNHESDDAGTYKVQPVSGGIFEGLGPFKFDDGALFYDVDWPDVIEPTAGAMAALKYEGGNGGTAGVQAKGTDGGGSIVLFGFPFETITRADDRAAMMERVLEFFENTGRSTAGSE
jgi:hypothetical protein